MISCVIAVIAIELKYVKVKSVYGMLKELVQSASILFTSMKKMSVDYCVDWSRCEAHPQD